MFSLISVILDSNLSSDSSFFRTRSLFSLNCVRIVTIVYPSLMISNSGYSVNSTFFCSSSKPMSCFCFFGLVI